MEAIGPQEPYSKMLVRQRVAKRGPREPVEAAGPKRQPRKGKGQPKSASNIKIASQRKKMQGTGNNEVKVFRQPVLNN